MNNHSIIGRGARLASAFHAPDAERFGVGDMITFEKADGSRGIITILGRDGDDGNDIDLMMYDGLPHYLSAGEKALKSLRVIRIETMDGETVNMYRGVLGLDPL